VGWWKRGNPVISPYSAFYYWSRTSCVIWRRSDTLSVWQCVLYVSAAISVVPRRPMSAQLCSCYCLRYVLRYEYINTTLRPRTSQCTTSVHVALSPLVYQCICANQYPLPYTRQVLRQCTCRTSPVCFVCASAICACQWLHLLYLHPYLMSVHLYICARLPHTELFDFFW
jgi:hypothetical protein